MRGLAIAAGLAVAAHAWQPAATVPPPPSVAVVIDVTAETLDAAASKDLRVRALSGLDPAAFRDVELTADTLRRVPDAERDDFRRTTFTVTPPRYNGLALTVDEAVEILRGNEARRDEIIERSCATAPPGTECGGLVRAAATSRVADAEQATRKKLRRLVDAARDGRPATLVLVTAGWPYRDAGRVGLDQAVRDLRALGTRLILLRVPAVSAYRGLVRDAGETLASQLAGWVVPLASDDDAAQVRTTLPGWITPAGTTPDVPATATNTPPTPAAMPPAATTAIPPAVPAVPDASPSGDSAGPVGEAPNLADLPRDFPAGLAQVAAYVDRFEGTFSSVVWRERSRQEVRVDRKFGTSGAATSVLTERRALDAEMFFVWLPRDATWITVRDVTAIDGVARGTGEQRLQTVLAGGAITTAQLRVLAAQNGRFDIGRIQRTFTEPTLVLLFLDPHYRDRFAFTAQARAATSNRRVAVWRFEERGRPTVIRNRDRDLPVRGTFTVDAATGQILETRLELHMPAAQPRGEPAPLLRGDWTGGLRRDSTAELRGEITVRFGPDARFDVLVPVEMRESYASLAGEHITTTAAYTDFRRFETAGRLIP